MILLLFAGRAHAAQRTDIEDLDVVISVQADSSWHVEQHFVLTSDSSLQEWINLQPSVDFTADGVRWQRDSRLDVSSIRADGGSVAAHVSDGELCLSVSSEETEVSLSFDCASGADGDPAGDLFCFALAGNQRSMPAGEVRFRLHMPEAVQADNVSFARGGHAGEAVPDVVWNLEGTTIEGSLSGLEPDESLWIRISLPDGYFHAAGPLSGAAALGVYGTLILTVVVIVIWLLVKRRRLGGVVAAEADPPAGLTPADIGCVADGAVEDADIAALLMHWAGQGSLQISEEEGTHGPEFVFERLADLPLHAHEYEKLLFGEMFRDGDIISSADLRSRTGRQMIRDTKRRIRRRFSSPPDSTLAPRSVMLSELCLFLAAVPPALVLAVWGYLTSYASAVAVLCGLAGFFSGLILGGWHMRLFDRRHSMIRPQRSWANILWGLLLVLYLAATAWAGAAFCGWYCLIPPAGSLIMMLLAPGCRLRTELGMIWCGQIVGLWSALLEKGKKTTGSDSMLIPYACVLRCSRDWPKRKGRGRKPDWYSGRRTPPELHTALRDSIAGRERRSRHAGTEN